MIYDVDLQLKPMYTAPKVGGGAEGRLLALTEHLECGMTVQTWTLVYWLEAFDGRVEGWYGHNCGDLRHPIGWTLVTADLPTKIVN